MNSITDRSKTLAKKSLTAALLAAAMGSPISRAAAAELVRDAAPAQASAGIGAVMASLSLQAQQSYGSDAPIAQFTSLDFSSVEGILHAAPVLQALPAPALKSLSDDKTPPAAKLESLASAISGVIAVNPGYAAQLANAPKIAAPKPSETAARGDAMKTTVADETRDWASSAPSDDVSEAAASADAKSFAQGVRPERAPKTGATYVPLYKEEAQESTFDDALDNVAGTLTRATLEFSIRATLIVVGTTLASLGWIKRMVDAAKKPRQKKPRGSIH